MAGQPKLLFNLNSKNKKYPSQLSMHVSVLPIALNTSDLVCSLGLCCIILPIQSSSLDSFPLQSCPSSSWIAGGEQMLNLV